ncbi:DASH family cryptochrome [Olivibacter ginsenosidimutans]|uniref:Cryptochrome DASH n=1 Tax=Olivibacter ginsenosidimutans TaxID=1176537 RepID=A0ABP9ASV4_9SPHI
MNKDTILVWFRNDLRVRDNEILWQALAKADKVVPVYVFDPRQFIALSDKTQKTGVIRAKFIVESVHDLKHSLQQLGADLLVASGYPEEILPTLAERYQVKEVYHHREVAKEETDVSSLVEEALWKKRLNLRHFIGHTLYHKEDLPFPIKDIPDAFATFRKKIERETAIRPMVATPTTIDVPEELERSTIPTLTALGYTDQQIALAQASPFKGGEHEGLKQLDAVLSDTSNHLIDEFPANDGTLLSPWIALGCLSPHTVYHTVKAAEADGLSKKIVQTIVFGLLWRDYFRFMFKKHGNKFFLANGFSNNFVATEKFSASKFDHWKNGKTTDATVNAIMHQLNTIGFIPYPARILAAHYLVNDLGINHLFGAAYFEDKLIDYSPASNYGNWAHVAGVGSSVKDNGVKDIKKIQALLDPDGAYVERWGNIKTAPTGLNI